MFPTRHKEIKERHPAGNDHRADLHKGFETKIKGKSANRLVLGFNKFTIPDKKIFEIELYEKGGGRHMKLAVENKYIIRAEPLFGK